MAIAKGLRLKRSGSVSIRQHEERIALLFLSPWLFGFLVFTAFPIVASMFISLTEYPILKSPEFVGIRNYTHMITGDPLFWQSLKVTTIYTLAIVPLQLVTAYALAILLNQTVHGLSVFRTVFFLPAVTPAVATALMWMWVFHPEIGLANSALAAIGVEGPKWLASTEWALPTFIIISLWGIGGGMVIYLAGLQSVPTSLYEAAELDGAGAWARFIHVTLPMTSPVILFVTVTSMIGSFQVFTAAFVMTDGGPVNSTLFFVLHLYNYGWRFLKMGYASALAWVLFVIILGLTLFLLRMSGRLVYYEAEDRT
jgi:multiple sugar transport system permease protein